MTNADTARPANAVSQTPPRLAERVLIDQVRGLANQLRELSADDWDRPTDCTGWNVRQVVAHIAGSLDEGAHPHVMLRHLIGARGASVDALNARQVADRARTTGPQLIAEIDRLGPVAARRRRRMPGALRRRRVPGGDLPDGSTFAYLVDVVYARDVWMHRIDIARASGARLPPTAGDGEVVAQVVRDLGRGWTSLPTVLELTGHAQSRWLLGVGPAPGTVSTDLVDYLRLLSGRPAQPQLAITGADPGAVDLLRTARVTF